MADEEKPRDKETISVDRERYENLLIELGEARKLAEMYAECKAALQEQEEEIRKKDNDLEDLKEILLEVEWKDYELDVTQKELGELRTEVSRLKDDRTWWKKLFG